VLLALLKVSAALLEMAEIRNDLASATWSPLNPILAQYRNQVLVDEAADFSAVQLACMNALTQRRIRSFFAAGDLNQRLTDWGVRSPAEMKWAVPDLEVRKVDVVYRQSRRLFAFARSLASDVGESKLPDDLNFDGVAPALLEQASHESAVHWLSCRIREIESQLHLMPSIALFVNTEAQVSMTADALRRALSDANISVRACHEGQVVGDENSVRVFDIQYIKGLEFEAAFFFDLTELAAQRPRLFDKFLYVGATRAATYLGAICSTQLPPLLEPLRSHFTSDWQLGMTTQDNSSQALHSRMPSPGISD
jgi:DNA helicase IV